MPRIILHFFMVAALLSLVSCGDGSEPVYFDNAEYKPNIDEVEAFVSENYIESEEIFTGVLSLSAQDALANLTDCTIILDVRPREYTSGWRIYGSVWLPYEEIRENAESILTDKNQIIFVSCREGITSENAVTKLFEMGYTSVFDIGSVGDWLGELHLEATGAIGFNYFGDDLPPDIITPINFTISQVIHEDLPEFTFTLRGTRREFYLLNRWETVFFRRDDLNTIYDITITCADENFFQELNDLNARMHTFEGEFGFRFNDWNFDGYLDISLPVYPGAGSSHPHFVWLWDGNEFVRNAQLEAIFEYTSAFVDTEINRVKTFSGRMRHWTESHYEYKNGDFVLVKQIFTNWIFTDCTEYFTERVATYELINGEMILTYEIATELTLE